ncbi:CocE/NonD family hydrolase [Salicibibacter cibarius]|uniref:CocE/NonD family hydrolase n=1 Tax=Salicibibacter cibarius TaxID=2743000 RepID=A0A7T7CAW3_9BACI|nr:CocE/NonD family hydrolase [Salicibibacter cibarius]QQK75275.1 CocE/NonD family hydrolase [Salicibibacter cibarius]
MYMEYDVECQCSDGTVLKADVYRPEERGLYPVLLLRLPYDKTNPHYYNGYLDVPRMVTAGYVVILQDVRGRYASGGSYYPFVYERKDGYEAVEWAAALPYSNGKVGMFGMSYHGYTQLAAAAEAPPSLYAIAPVMAIADGWVDMVQDVIMPFDHGSLATWTLESILPDQLKRQGHDAALAHTYAYMEELSSWLHDQPMTEWAPMKNTAPNSFYFDFVNRQVNKQTIQQVDLREQLKHIHIPALFIGGWFDSLLGQTLGAYQQYGGKRMLWIGPWTHSNLDGWAGDVFFDHATTPLGADQLKDLTDLHIRWFDHWLKDRSLNIEKPVHVYRMGQRRWDRQESWPLNDVGISYYYLDRHENMSVQSSVRALEKKKPETNHTDRCPRNPAVPFPTCGGNLLMAGHGAGMFEQGDLHKREDTLVFTTQSLDRPLDVLGAITANVWVSSDSPLVDLFLQVSDVTPDGNVYNVVDTFTRGTGSDSGRPQCVQVDLIPTSYRFGKGHAIRLAISGSNAPRFDVNQNNGMTSRTTTGGKPANDVFFYGKKYPSFLSIPRR